MTVRQPVEYWLPLSRKFQLLPQVKLSKLSGAEFDKEYMSEMVKDHEEDAEEFQTEAKGPGR